MVMIYSNIVPLGWANPVEASCCEVLYDDPRRITVDAVIAAADDVLRQGVAAGGPDAPSPGYRVRIAFFNDVAAMGGGELWVLGACRRLAAMGHQVTVVCPWRSELYRAASPKASTSSRT